MDVSHSVLYDTIMNFCKNSTIVELGDKLLPVFQHGFLRSEKNVVLNNFKHLKVYGRILCPIIFLNTYVC